MRTCKNLEENNQRQEKKEDKTEHKNDPRHLLFRESGSCIEPFKGPLTTLHTDWKHNFMGGVYLHTFVILYCIQKSYLKKNTSLKKTLKILFRKTINQKSNLKSSRNPPKQSKKWSPKSSKNRSKSYLKNPQSEKSYRKSIFSIQYCRCKNYVFSTKESDSTSNFTYIYIYIYIYIYMCIY